MKNLKQYLFTFIFLSSSLFTIKADDQHEFLLEDLKEMGCIPKSQEFTGKQKKNNSTIHQASRAIKKLINYSPDPEFKAGIETYIDIINSKDYHTEHDIGLKNSGLAAHNQHIVKSNPCFSDLAQEFYNDITTQDQLSPNKDNLILDGRPSLALESGKGQFTHLEPGWLLKKAMKATGNNANLALQLLSLCGHDDVSQGDLIYKSLSPNKNRSFYQYIDYVDTQLKEAHYFGNRDKDSITKLRECKNKLQNKSIETLSNTREQISCPEQNSTFYLAKSLGNSIDLSDKYKEKIATLQAPERGKKAIPSKNYHIMGAAFMACQLVSKGVSPKIATAVQKAAAWSYRTIRISSMMNKDIKSMDKYKNHYKQYLSKKNPRQRRGVFPIPKKKPVMNFTEWMWDMAFVKNRYHSLGMDSELGTKSDTEKMKALNNWFAKRDAAEYIAKMTLGGGEILGHKIPHTNLTLTDIDNPIDQVIFNSKHKRSKKFIYVNPMNWDADRFDRAQKKAASYLIDWDWTTKQHEIGAKLGANLCKKTPPDYMPDSFACGPTGEHSIGVPCPTLSGIMNVKQVIELEKPVKDITQQLQ